MPRTLAPAPFILGFLVLLAGFSAASTVRSATAPIQPTRIWVAWLGERALEDAMKVEAVLLDRFPDAVLVADSASATALAVAGYRVETPIAVPSGRTLTLVRPHDHADGSAAAMPAADDFEREGATLLWSGGRNGIAASDGPLPETGLMMELERKGLRDRPLRRREVQPFEAGRSATVFDASIQSMVNEVSGGAMIQTIGDFAGARAVMVGGTPSTFTTRSTITFLCDRAEQYTLERFQSLGFTDVQYDPFTFSGVSARNVVATLPGTKRPGRVVLLGAHLDSTSPQPGLKAPGANDNASGIAGLLMAAEILKQRSFENTLRFVAFTGEEQGLYGSAHYANAAAARGDTIVGVVIFDMIGWYNTQYKIDIEGETAWLPLMTVMNDACAQYTSLATQMQFVSFGSDHVPFQDVGYPAFLAIESEYPQFPCYHKQCDTTSWNNAAFIADVMRASVATAAHLAIPRPLPLALSHAALTSTENTAGPYEIVADITGGTPLVADSLLLHWSAGGAIHEVPLTAAGPPGRYHAFIPGQPATSRITYWLSARDTSGASRTSPPGAPGVRHEFLIGTRTVVFAEGFESGGAGWTHGGVQDDWQIGPPAGLSEDPAAAFEGTGIAGTDLSGLGASPGRYENGAESWFESPPIDCTDQSQVRLSFARWLSIERSNGGAADYARVLVNGTPVWESPSATDLLDAAWQVQDLDISSLADGQPQVRVRFTLHSDGATTYGGWNLDDVRLSGIGTQVTAGVPPSARAAALRFSIAPNPASRATALRFGLAERLTVSLDLLDVRGRHVRTLIRGEQPAGEHRVLWDGRADDGSLAPSGIYFARLRAGDATTARRLVLMH